MAVARGRGFWPMRDLPVVGWLAATVLVALAHPFLPVPRWLLIHLLLLGAATHAIVVWSRYFTDALLRTRSEDRDRTGQDRRLALLNVGVLLVGVGIVSTVWPVTVAGAAAVVGAVGWHALTLVARLRAALPGRFDLTVRYYVAAAALLAVGAGLGIALARVQADPWHTRLLVAHASVNVLGWIGITALGTLVTLGPTILRTRIADGAEQAAARALPLLVAGVLAAAAGAVADLRPVTGLGYLAYLAGLGLLVRGLVSAARSAPPRSFPAYSVAAAVVWLTGCLVSLVVVVLTAGSWADVDSRFTWFTPFLAAGFGAQLLLGALSYLVPVALGGGPGPVRAATTVLDRCGLLRVAATNAALLVCVLPVAPAVRVLASTVALVSLASFLPLLALALRASRAVRSGRREPPPQASPVGHRRRQAALGVAVVLVAAAGGVAVDRGLGTFVGTPVAARATPTGHTTVVEVEARDMRFHPASVDVPAGDRLVIELSNTDDEDVHDLVLDDGSDTGRLSPGESATLDVGVVGRDVAGWCSVVGHHQMGMAFAVRVVGGTSGDGPAAPAAHSQHSEHSEHEGSGPDPGTTPGSSFRPHDPALPLEPQGRVHRRTLHMRDVVREVAPGITQQLWTYGGSVPGPTLHGRVGDRFVITLVNDGTLGHSIDFHAGERAPDDVMRTIPPGGRLVYRFTAERAGVWMYHCSTMPMSAHIANGLFGAVVIEPRDLAPVDRSFLLVQSELYLGPEGGEVDADKASAEDPDLVVFNGYADQYDHRPLRVRAGDRVRIWVLDAGPSRATSFHVVGAQLDATYAEGSWLLRGGSGGAQSLALAPSQGGFVELSLDEPGDYPFVSHVMVDAERGAHGILRVTD
ncbi:multicopper oxidase domain-containing protein [Nocardioides terrigena]|uniref:multicopper oxidase domain-containing protein n=1 Tax=Nocardioides terrigena TaxID=424797 RepID=UPI0018FF905D|nr:multicopper oxidase domain-containing protein [Nocardioides terrigena]